MKIVVTSNGSTLDAPVSPVFGRCPTYVFVDTETMGCEAVDNPAVAAPGGAGIQAAQFVVAQGAQAIVGGNVGPNAIGVLQAANVPLYLFDEGSVRQAVEAFKRGELREATGASVAEHSGMARASRRGDSGGKTVHESEINELRQQAAALRQQLATLVERIGVLEREDR
jgi:predicted Fe-Mo cluster-binding NifX family protein